MALSHRELSSDDGTPVPALLRPNDVARMFSVSRAWVYEAARTGRIPSIRARKRGRAAAVRRFRPRTWLAEVRASWRPGRSWHAAHPQPEEPVSVVPIRGQQSLL